MQRIDFGTSSYPRLLSKIHAPPQQLYVRGVFDSERPLVAIVGSRKATPYSTQVLQHIIPSLVAHGVGVVSGLAYGVDTLAHQITVRRDGYTIAVVPGGCDDASIYPQQNHKLAHAILSASGAVISEHPAGSRSPKYSFPRRNRIIAGLCALTIVIEAAQKSGTKITANHALEYNRMVGAIPGSVFSPLSAGCHDLIANGAFPITSATDILQLLDISPRPKSERHIPEEYRPIYQACMRNICAIDDLVSTLDLPHPIILRTITLMELNGLIKDTGGKRYISM